MTVSSCPCCKRTPERKSAGILVAALWLFALFLAFPAAAYEPEVRYAELVPTDDLYVINSDFAFELGPRLEEVVVHGIPLHFVAECVVTRGRWYWRDERIVEKRLAFRISFQALTRKYRLSVGSLGRSFDTLNEAVGAMKRLRNWGIVDRDRLKGGETYNVALRFRLDTNMLPKPFQVTAIGSREWSLETPWSSWSVLASNGR
ncbi:DUF4390 domain-containing protein [Niveibacterium terrae]|uniref:DUF4390 domain-containing protein n=1 Tax=Niveibacterium terrae TaxID=3373598 RepID=UPI003A9282CC